MEVDTIGYHYSIDLCKAIENYTINEIKTNSTAFVYQQIDLTYAIQRLLYIECINSTNLFQQYAVQNNIVITDCLSKARTNFDYLIAPFLLGRPIKNRLKFFIHFKIICKIIIKNLLKSIKIQKNFKENVNESNLLIHIHHIKFETYFKKITDVLGNLEYDYLSLRNEELTKELISRGHSVIYPSSKKTILQINSLSRSLLDFTSLIEESLLILYTLKEKKPNKIIVIEGNSHLDLLTLEASKVLGIPCYCLQQGWSPIVHTGFRNMSFTAMFVWGKYFAEVLQPYNPSQLFQVTGSHLLGNHNYLEKKNNNKNAISFFLQSPSILISINAYEDFLKLILSVANSLPNQPIIVRDHPSYSIQSNYRAQFSKHSNIYFSNPLSEGLVEVLNESIIAVSIFSTVLLECIASRVVPVVCNFGSIKKYEPDLTFDGLGIEANSVEDGLVKIVKLISNPFDIQNILSKQIVNKKYYFHDGESVKLICNYLKK